MNMLVNRVRNLVLAVLATVVWMTPAASGQDVDKFVKEFEKAFGARDFTQMRSLTSGSRSLAKRGAKTYEGWICQLAAKGDEGSLERASNIESVLDELAVVYKLEHKDEFIHQRVAWLKGLDVAQKKQRWDAIKQSNDGYNHSIRGKNEGGDEHFKNAVEPFMKAISISNQLKDWSSAADDASQLAFCFQTLNDGFAACYYAHVALGAANNGGIRSAYAEGNGKVFARAKEKKQVYYPEIIRIDLPLEESRKQYEVDAAEKARVKPDPEGKGDGGAKGSGGGGSGLTPPTSEAPFEFVDHKKKFKASKVDLGGKVPQVSYLNGRPEEPSIYPFARYNNFEKGSDERDFFLPGAKIKNDGKIFIDSAGTGKFKKIKVKAKPSTAKFDVKYADNSKLKLTMALWEENPNYQLFGTRFNNPNSHKFTRLAARNTTGLSGKIRGNEVTFIDNNANGVYHDEGVDAIMVGKGKTARIDPFGRYVMLKEANGYYPYELKMNKKDASLVRTRPYKGQLAPLSVSMKTATGVKPSFLIVKGNGEDASAYFDIAKAIDEPIWLPVGRYQIRQGYFTLGKGKKQSHIFIGTGRSGAFEVEAGKINTWELGGSGEQGYWLLGKFERGSDASEVVADNKELRVFGNFGESYFGFTSQGDRPLPTIEIRKEDENGKKVGSAKTRNASGNGIQYIDLWFPANVAIKNCPRGKLVGQLTLEHPVLGTAKSAWLNID